MRMQTSTCTIALNPRHAWHQLCCMHPALLWQLQPTVHSTQSHIDACMQTEGEGLKEPTENDSSISGPGRSLRSPSTLDPSPASMSMATCSILGTQASQARKYGAPPLRILIGALQAAVLGVGDAPAGGDVALGVVAQAAGGLGRL